MSTLTADQTLMTLLCHSVAANRAEQKTLTLVVPGTVALQPDFFCDLAEQWQTLRKQLGIAEPARLRIDCCHDDRLRGPISMMSGWLRQFELMRCRRALFKRDADTPVSLTRCLVIGRPNSDEQSVVMGIADESVTLPTWAKPATMRLSV